MRIVAIEDEPFWSVPYLNLCRDGSIETLEHPCYRAVAEGIPNGLHGIFCAADLQGHAAPDATDWGRKDDAPLPLMGQAIPGLLQDLTAKGDLPAIERMGAILAGDLFAKLEKRGGYGDSTPVWVAFGEAFKWAAGVAGNHDTFGKFHDSIPNFKTLGYENIHVEEAEVVRLDALRIGLVSGCIGNARRPFRYVDEDYFDRLLKVLAEPLDILVMHDGPDDPSGSEPGWPVIRELLEDATEPFLVVRGHKCWQTPFVELKNGVQVLNCEDRMVMLQAQA